MKRHFAPYLFDEYFASGKEESISPFLKSSAKKWGRHLALKVALTSTLFLAIAFCTRTIAIPISHLCLLFVFVLSGTPAILQTCIDIRNLEINIDVLMTLAALLSLLMGSGLEGALLLVLFELSGAVELSVMRKTQEALTHLHKLSPTKATVITSSKQHAERSVRDIGIGTHIFVQAGEMIPMDGMITEGSSFITLSHLTGESTPLAKKQGDMVVAGAHNLDGSLVIEVSQNHQNSTLHKILQMITNAKEAKPKVQCLIDRFGHPYACTIIALTAFFSIFLPFVLPLSYFGIEGSIYRALTFLVAASPCALIIATPTAYLSALSSAAKKGILLKGGVLFDVLAKCHKIAFDKTGTLTTGNLTCTKMQAIHEDAISLDQALAIAGTMERHVKHPIAQAIVFLAKERNLPEMTISHLKSIPGSGIQAEWEGHLCFLGNRSFILQHFHQELPAYHEGSTQAYFLIKNTVIVFVFEDEIRKEAHSLLDRLQKHLKMTCFMLTGDEERNAHVVARKLGITQVFWNLKPEDKLHKIDLLSQQDDLIMVGDGVNDAPALARASIGISMGEVGSSTAVDVSDIVFLHDDLSSLDWLLHKAHHTLCVLHQNLCLALAVILLATTPALLGWIPLWIAVILHEGGTLLVGLNSLRLLRTRLRYVKSKSTIS